MSWFSLAAYSVATSTIVFRTTGQAEFGIWATIAAFRSALLFLDAGLAYGSTRDAALAMAGDAIARRRWRASMIIYLAGAIFALIAAVVFADVPGKLLGIEAGRPDVAWIALIIGAEVAVTLACSPILAGLRGVGRFDLLAGSSLVTAAVGIGLLVALTPLYGLLGAAIALVVARLAGTLSAVVWFRSSSPGLGGGGITGNDARAVARFALPMWAVAIGSAVGVATDVPIVGAFFGADAAGAYGIGAVVPSVAAGLVFVLLDTAFPRLTTLARASFGHVIRVLATVGTLVAAIGLGSLILSAEDILDVWLGETTGLASAALAAYAVVWLANVPAHVLVLAAVARDRHQLIGLIVLVEALANVALSVALAISLGPIGPAVASVVTVVVSNVVILPWLLGQKVGITPGRLLLPAFGAATLGMAIAIVARAPALVIDDPALRVVVHAFLATVAIGVVGVGAIKRRTAFQRWVGVLFDGGWRVIRAERRERTVMKVALASAPVLNLGTSPLVTVRIATYNRGQLVAERAIASALAQTYRNIEIVVVGDHCDLATEQAVRGVRDPRIRFENLAERGRYPDDSMFRWMVAGTAPMNRALELAQGEWIAPLDDDDEFTPDHIEVLLDACRSRNLDVAYGVANMEVQPGTWEPVGSWPPEPGGIIHAAVMYSSRLRTFRHSNESWRLNEPGDWNLWRRMIAAGARFGFVDRVVVRHYLEYREVLAEVT